MKAVKSNKNQNSTKKGFTIIEVVLVLAVAGLIFLMIFLALPALQRSQRDTERKQDIAMLVTALQNWKTANRGKGYATLGDSKTEERILSDDYDRENKLSVSVMAIKNSPLNDYIGIKDDSSNKSDSSSSLSQNTHLVRIYKTSGSLLRLDAEFFKENKAAAIPIGYGCNDMETLQNGSVVLKDRKPGTAAVIHFMETGGVYCQEA